MSKDIDPFENAIQLEKSLETPEVEETSEEDMNLAKIGFNLDKVATYKKEHNVNSVMFQNFPKNDFLDDYLDYRCNNAELIELKKHPEAFRELQNKKINNLIAKNPETKENSLIAQYIEKNAELIAEKDKLFKQVQVLQSERDQWKELTEKSDKYIGLAIQLIRIFKEQKIKADLPNETIQLIKELSSK